MRASGGANARFKGIKPDPARAFGLKPGHPALFEGRTIFPSKVVSAVDTPRLFVSGANNGKLGRQITKGRWAGMPLYHLTLEERATCPRSCAVWDACYGNTTHLARRHRADGNLIERMMVELAGLNLVHPEGFAVRLHTLGDFWSVDYVRAWERALNRFSALHVFGFTARDEDQDDDESRAIAAAIRSLSTQRWSRFAIRFSRRIVVPQGAVVVEIASVDPSVIMCPAQTEATACCATCGLCWSGAAKEKTIGFLRHGMKRRGSA